MNTTNNESAVGVLAADLNGQGLHIGIVQARFNEEHCTALSTACIEELIALGVAQEDIKLVTVPGALEIAFALQKLVETGEFDGLVALGAVIRGETYHFESDGTLTYSFVESVKATFPFYVIRLMGGLCYLSGMFLMAFNVFKTVQGKTFINAPIPMAVAEH